VERFKKHRGTALVATDCRHARKWVLTVLCTYWGVSVSYCVESFVLSLSLSLSVESYERSGVVTRKAYECLTLQPGLQMCWY